jgi:hypothetical protein
VNVFLWHIHGAWTTAFVQGPHRYLVPVLPDRGPDGLGRARTYPWPDNVVEVTPEEAARADVDVVVLQRPKELNGLAAEWLGGRRPGRDIPAVYVEHDAPQGLVADMEHPAAARSDLVVVHVTHFNSLFWQTGRALTRVIEHGVVDPGYLYSGELPRAAVVINEARRRGRVTGTDLLPWLGEAVPIDLFGMGAEELTDEVGPDGRCIDDLPQAQLHAEMARRRVYLHPVRWTSLGLALIEAMHLGMPVIALSTTEVPEAVPRDAGVVSNQLDVLVAELRRLVAEPEEAALMGKAARVAALSRYGLERFLADWEELLSDVVR